MRLQYTKEALEDLRSIREYIYEKSGSENIADNVVQSIVRSCALLKEFPNIGAELSGKIGVETEYRYLVCGRSIVFYTIEVDEIVIDRILDGRRDYIRVLFSESLKKDDTG